MTKTALLTALPALMLLGCEVDGTDPVTDTDVALQQQDLVASVGALEFGEGNTLFVGDREAGLGQEERARRLELARRLGPGEVGGHTDVFVQQDESFSELPIGGGLALFLDRSGNVMTPIAFVGGTIALAAFGLVIGFLAGGSWRIAVGLAAAAAPYLYVRWSANKRNAMITQQIPDTLDLMGRALRSGHAFGDALRVAGEESPAPIGEEFGRAAEEHRLGIELRAALEGLAARTPENFELRMLVSGVMLNRETGGNLIEMLENMAEVVRERLVFEGKVKALTAEVRTSAAILSALPFFAALGIMWARPGYLEPLFEPGPGQYMLAYGLCSMVVGLFVMRRISDVEY